MKLTFSALRIQQRRDVPLYVFGVEGHSLRRIAAVSAASRDDDGSLVGYQREKVTGHIRQIAAYLTREDALLPNALVVAFSRGFEFRPLAGAVNNTWGTPGRLTIDIPDSGPKPGLVVDGQQRMSALSMLPVNRRFPVVVVGFVASDPGLQREQFVLVNRTKPLPRDLLNELLPHMDGDLPKAMGKRRIAGQVVERLRFDATSPFFGRVRGIGATGSGSNISLASVLGVVETSVRARGVLAPYLATLPGDEDIDSAFRTVCVYYAAVARVWPDAWAGSPWTSRLVHGVGIAGTGRLMDVVMMDVDANKSRAVSTVARRLSRIASRPAWTHGRWGAPIHCEWNELQNTSQDKRRLGEALISWYAKAPKK